MKGERKDWEVRRDRVEASADAILAALREHGGEDVPQQVLLDAQLRDDRGLVDVALIESLDRLRNRGIEVVRLRNGYPVEVGLYMHHPITYTIRGGQERMTGEGEFAPGGRRVGEGGTWTPVMVPCGPWEARCRRAYAAAGWPAKWAYDFMPRWLKPGWHHEGPATHVPREAEGAVKSA